MQRITRIVFQLSWLVLMGCFTANATEAQQLWFTANSEGSGAEMGKAIREVLSVLKQRIQLRCQAEAGQCKDVLDLDDAQSKKLFCCQRSRFEKVSVVLGRIE